MKLFKITLTGFFLFSSIFVWASGPPTVKSADSGILQNTFTLSQSSVASYGDAMDIKEPLLKQIEYGGIFGFNFTSNGQHPSFFSNPEYAPVFGPTIALPFLPYLGARLELLFSQNVFSGESSFESQPTTYLNRLTYIDIPLMLQIKPIDDLSLIVGGDASLLLGNSYSYAEAPSNTPALNSNPKKSFLGLLFGIEYTVYGVTGGFRMTLGVPDNNNLPTPTTIIGQFSLGYSFQPGLQE